MSESLSISSQLMTKLLMWRNSREREAETVWERAGKVVSTELGLLILATTAVVESVANVAFTFFSLIFYSAADQPCKFFASQLISSSFTILWGIADALIYNPFYDVVEAQEKVARSTTYALFECLLPGIDCAAEHEEKTDGGHGAYEAVLPQWNRLPQEYNYVFDLEVSNELIIEREAAVLYKELLAGASKETLTLFKEMDADIFMFILTKAIFTYVAGSRKYTGLPVFFSSETNRLIRAWRLDFKDKELVRELEMMTSNPMHFESTPKSTAVKNAFNRLKNIASEEQQGCKFIEKYWRQAIKALS